MIDTERRSGWPAEEARNKKQAIDPYGYHTG
jgi:hypothetical protein